MKCTDNKDLEKHFTIGKEYRFIADITPENILTIDNSGKRFIVSRSRFTFENNDILEIN